MTYNTNPQYLPPSKSAAEYERQIADIMGKVSYLVNEAHMRGRIYSTLGEPETPAQVYISLQKLIDIHLPIK